MAPRFLLRVLGSVSLEGVDEPAGHLILAHPKRLALLTHLLLSRPSGYHRRETLFALLWPESDTERARSSLRQAVHQIRRVLGHQAILSRGDEDLTINRDMVGCDALEFESLALAGRRAAALELYRGDLLPGFYAGDAAAFEEWTERERTRLRGMAVRAGWDEAEALAAKGDPEGAARRAQTAAGLEPYDELAQQRLIELLSRLDRPAEAVSSYESFRARLRREFDTEPAPETEALAADARASAAEAAARASARLASSPAGVSPASLAGSDIAVRPGHEPWFRRRGAALLFASGALAVLVLAAARARLAGKGVGLDPNAVVVAPFRLSSADTSLGFLREGLVDLISAKLDGSPGLRAVDARAVLAAWRRAEPSTDVPLTEARRLAGQLRAGRVLVGAVVGRPERLVVTAAVHDVHGTAARETVTREGPLDSLPELVDRLVAGILTSESQEPGTRLRQLTTGSPAALRKYLQGRAAYRRGRYTESADLLREAAELDSSSAIIWLELSMVAPWIADADVAEPRRQAWRLRNRLPPRERVLLEASAGPRFPQLPRLSEWVSSWERAARLMPDRPEVLFELGDRLFHYGAATGRDSAGLRAKDAFSRAVALDSSYAAPLLHLTQIAIREGDLRAARRLSALYFARDSAGDDADFLRWRLAVALGDSLEASRIERRFGSISDRSLVLIATWSQLDGVSVPSGLRAAEELARRSDDHAGLGTRVLALTYGNLGRFGDRQGQFRRWGLTAREMDNATVSDATSWEGNRLAAESVLARRSSGVERQDERLNTMMLREFMVGEPGRALPAAAEGLTMPAIWQALNALRKARSEPAAARGHLARLDSMSMTGPPGSYLFNWAALVSALAYERLGDRRRALQAVRARALIDEPGLSVLSTMLRVEGRLALALGDTVAARRAWTHYLALRYNPDPTSRPAADSVRAALEALNTGRGRPR